jgi:hypothetical protein
MRSRLLSISLITIVISGLFADNLLTRTVSAKGDNSYSWDAPVKVSRTQTAKPGRKSRPKPVKPEEVPLLTLNYQVLTRGDGGTMQRVDAAQQDFKTGDQMKLAVTPNQSGFLYIVHHSVDNKNNVIDRPHVVFPHKSINEGRNEVKKDEQYLVPKYCPQLEDPNDCWWEITPPSGKDVFTVIFSRDKITDLTDKLSSNKSTDDPDAVDMNIISKIKSTSNTKDIARVKEIKFSSTRETKSDGTYVQNTNKNDNEEIFETIELRHQSEAGNTPVALTRALFVKKRSDAIHISFLKKGGGEVDPSRDVFTSADALTVRCESNFNGYVYFVNITPSGRKFLIFPCGKVSAYNLAPGFRAEPEVLFDDEKGTEVLQVIMSRDRIDFFESAMKGECCSDPTKCELSASAANAASELASNAAKQQKGGIEVNNVMAVVPPNASSGGIRARGIALVQGKDSNKGGSYVAIESPANSTDNKLEAGRYAVFEIRLNHK